MLEVQAALNVSYPVFLALYCPQSCLVEITDLGSNLDPYRRRGDFLSRTSHHPADVRILADQQHHQPLRFD